MPAPHPDTSFAGRIRGRFLRLTIAGKMLLGYTTLVALIFIISAVSISSLERLNAVNRAIIQSDLPLIETTDRMVDSVISEELYSRRAAILDSSEMLSLSQARGEDFNRMEEKIRNLPHNDAPSIERIASLHDQYQSLLKSGRDAFRNPASTTGRRLDSAIRDTQNKIIGLLRDISGRARHDQDRRSLDISRIGTEAFRALLLLCIVSILASIAATILITRSIAGPIARLKQATAKISEGAFDLIEAPTAGDELADLSNAFNEMTRRLKRLEEMHLDASPLTRLPGNAAIENVLQKRIENGGPIAFCHIDMDNFKAFSDRYGYAKGSEIILATSKVIERCVAELGAAEDFLGHIGGDDFVLISTPDRFKNICTCITATFDRTIPAFYDPSDLERGFIVGKSRTGEQVSYPIMTISIAVVTNHNRPFVSSLQVGELAAELKEYAKSVPGSLYVVDRRRGTAEKEVPEHA